jgi:hypothetical protein
LFFIIQEKAKKKTKFYQVPFLIPLCQAYFEKNMVTANVISGEIVEKINKPLFEK